MTPSEQIRKSALGPAPRRVDQPHLAAWVHRDASAIYGITRGWCDRNSGPLLRSMTNTERRMFLLFVAEALQ